MPPHSVEYYLGLRSPSSVQRSKLVSMIQEGTVLSPHIWHHQPIQRNTLRFVAFQPFPQCLAHSPKWCSLCGDLGTILVLCSGCRVAVCVKSRDTIYGCLRWSAEIETDDFVFYCQYCSWARRGTSRVSGYMPIEQLGIIPTAFPPASSC